MPRTVGAGRTTRGWGSVMSGGRSSREARALLSWAALVASADAGLLVLLGSGLARVAVGVGRLGDDLRVRTPLEPGLTLSRAAGLGGSPVWSDQDRPAGRACGELLAVGGSTAVAVPVRDDSGARAAAAALVWAEPPSGYQRGAAEGALRSAARSLTPLLPSIRAADLDPRRADAVEQLIGSGGPRIALQPVFHPDGTPTGSSLAFARFTRGEPEQWFDDARRDGVGEQLEALCLDRAGDVAAVRSTRVCVRLSAAAATSAFGARALARAPLPLVTLVLDPAEGDDWARGPFARERDHGLTLGVLVRRSRDLLHARAVGADVVHLPPGVVGAPDHHHRRFERLLDRAAGAGLPVLVEGVQSPEELAVVRAHDVAGVAGRCLATPRVVDRRRRPR